jgi:hypothetical protein
MYILTVSCLVLHGADQDRLAELGTDLDMRLLDGLVLMRRGKLSLTCNPTGKSQQRQLLAVIQRGASVSTP